jgi:hypothetical protein
MSKQIYKAMQAGMASLVTRLTAWWSASMLPNLAETIEGTQDRPKIVGGARQNNLAK